MLFCSIKTRNIILFFFNTVLRCSLEIIELPKSSKINSWKWRVFNGNLTSPRWKAIVISTYKILYEYRFGVCVCVCRLGCWQVVSYNWVTSSHSCFEINFGLGEEVGGFFFNDVNDRKWNCNFVFAFLKSKFITINKQLVRFFFLFSGLSVVPVLYLRKISYFKTLFFCF